MVQRRSRYEDLMCCSTLGMNRTLTSLGKEGLGLEELELWGDQSRPSSFPTKNPTREGFESRV